MVGCYDTVLVPGEDEYPYFVSRLSLSGSFVWQHYLSGIIGSNALFNLISTRSGDIVSVGYFVHDRQDTVNAIRAHIISVDSNGNRN
jgi:hypothetical protein